MSTAKYKEIQFDNSDVVNPDDFIPAGSFNPHNIHPILIHDHGFTVAIIFAEHLQDALDIAVDNGKLDAFLIEEKDYGDYILGPDQTEESTCTFLGNASEPFDIDTIGSLDLPNPKFSFTALFNEAQKEESK